MSGTGIWTLTHAENKTMNSDIVVLLQNCVNSLLRSFHSEVHAVIHCVLTCPICLLVLFVLLPKLIT